MYSSVKIRYYSQNRVIIPMSESRPIPNHLSDTILEATQDELQSRFRSLPHIDDILNGIAIEEGERENGLFDEIYEYAQFTYGEDDDTELNEQAAAFSDGAILALAVADSLAERVGVDPSQYRSYLLRTWFAESPEIGEQPPEVSETIHYVHGAFTDEISDVLERASDGDQQRKEAAEVGYKTFINFAIAGILHERPFAEIIAGVSAFEQGVTSKELWHELDDDTPDAEVYPEVIPEAYAKQVSLFDYVDTERTADLIKGRILSGTSASDEIRRLYNFNKYTAPELLERIINIGKYVEEYDDDLEVVDEALPRTKAFLSGASVALGLVDIISFDVRQSRTEWRDRWNALPPKLDSPVPVDMGPITTPRQCYEIGNRLVSMGADAWEKLPPAYKDVIEAIENQYGSINDHVNIFRASYAYILSWGAIVLNEVVMHEFPDQLKTIYSIDIPDTIPDDL